MFYVDPNFCATFDISAPKDAVVHTVMFYVDPNFANLQYSVCRTPCACTGFGWVWCSKMSLLLIRTPAKALMACFPTIYTVYVYTWLHHSVGSLPLAKNALHSPTSIHMSLSFYVTCYTLITNEAWPTGPWCAGIQKKCIIIYKYLSINTKYVKYSKKGGSC